MTVIQNVGVALVVCITIIILTWLFFCWKKEERKCGIEDRAKHQMIMQKRNLQDKLIAYIERQMMGGKGVAPNDKLVEEVKDMLDKIEKQK